MSELDQLIFESRGMRKGMRPTKATWLRHSALLVLTLITCTVAGVIYPFGPIFPFEALASQPSLGLFEVLAAMPYEYANLVGTAVSRLLTESEILWYGLSFSVSILFILISHEAGHYIACRIYGVDATLPFFIPTPPLIGPAGTLGAFIKIVSPMPSRRAVFDIGVAGPIAGFVALIPISILAFVTMEEVQRVPNGLTAGDLYFSDPIFMKVVAELFARDLTQVVPNGFYFATWLGLLVTALNLIPSGQLDGGHAIYAVFGEKFHYWTGRIAFVFMAVFSVLGMYIYGSPSGFLFAIILAVMMRIGHPQPMDNRPLDAKRVFVAILTLAIFVLCFVPFPIQLR